MNANEAILVTIAKAIEAGRDNGLGSRSIAEDALLALDAAGYAIKAKPKPRKAAEPVEIFSPNTGDAALDEFMRAHHDPKYKPLPMPKSTFPGRTQPSLAKMLAEAIAVAKKNNWPGTYSGNFALPKNRR